MLLSSQAGKGAASLRRVECSGSYPALWKALGAQRPWRWAAGCEGQSEGQAEVGDQGPFQRGQGRGLPVSEAWAAGGQVPQASLSPEQIFHSQHAVDGKET